MSRTINRRTNKLLRRVSAWKELGPVVTHKAAGNLLAQWQREADFRAERFRDKRHTDIRQVWDLQRIKEPVATELGISEELSEICRQAVARHMGTGKTRLGASKIFV